MNEPAAAPAPEVPPLTLWRSLFRLEAFDVSTEEGRSRERYRRLAWTSTTSLAAKAISILTVFLSARFTLPYLGVERYGLWMTITSLVSMLGFTDLGLGNGLMNDIGHAHGRRDADSMKTSVSTAFFMLCLIAAVLLVCLAAAYPLVPWAGLFNVKSAVTRAEAGPASAAFFFCFIMGLPLGIVGRVWTALQEGFYANFWQMAGNLGALAGVIAAIHFDAGLPWLVLALSGPPLLALAVGGFFLFLRSKPELRPQRALFSRTAARSLLGRGTLFLCFSALGPVAFYSDNLIVAHFVGAEAVATYAVTVKLFNLCTLLVGMVGGSLWPAYAEAYAGKDYAWMKTTLIRSLTWSSLVIGVPAVILIFTAPWFLKAWLGTPMTPGLPLCLGLAFWAIVSNIGFALGNVLWSMNMLKYDLLLTAGMTLLAMGLKLWLTSKFGVPGVVWGLTIAYAAACLPSLWFIPRLFRLLEAGKPPSQDTLWIPKDHEALK